jgi:hypothetical protein
MKKNTRDYPKRKFANGGIAGEPAIGSKVFATGDPKDEAYLASGGKPLVCKPGESQGPGGTCSRVIGNEAES